MPAASSASSQPGRNRKQSLMNRRAVSDRNRHRLMKESRSPGGQPPRRTRRRQPAAGNGGRRCRRQPAAGNGGRSCRRQQVTRRGGGRLPGRTCPASCGKIRTSGGTRAPRGGHRPIQGRPRQGQWTHTYLFPVKSREMSGVSSHSIDESRVLRENANRCKNMLKAI